MIDKASKEKVKDKDGAVEQEAESISHKFNSKINEIIENKQNPVKILVSIILRGEETEE